MTPWNLTGRMLVYVLLVGAVFAVTGCSGSSPAQPQINVDDARHRQQSRGNQRTPWKLAYPPGGSMVRIGVSVRYCVGEPKPRITEVRVRERKGAVVLTVFVSNVREPEKGRACAGLRLGFGKTVELSKGLGTRALYDGSTSPPRKRWPLPRSR